MPRKRSIRQRSAGACSTRKAPQFLARRSACARPTRTSRSRPITEADGRFRFPYLKIGPYELRAKLQGFKENARTLILSAGSAFDIPITLEVAGIDTAVTVVADSQVLETARSQIAGTVPQAEVQNLPMNGRNFLDLALLVPGVSPTNTNSTQLFAETSAVPGQGLSIASQRNLSNSFIVDGVSANDDAAGLSGITFGVDAIEQFQVVTGGGQAELGRALGGYVNVVTKSGTNALHGSLYGFFRDDAFNGKNALTGTTLPMDQQQFGVSLGGPLRRDRTFYFTNVERKVLDQTGVVSITSENVATINPRLAQVGYQGLPVETGIYPNPVHSSNVLGKIDHQFSGADQLSVRYALYDVISDNARGVGNLNAPSGSTGLDNRDQSIAISNVWMISANTVSETRVQIAHGDLKAYSTDQIGPQVTIAGVATFGTFSSSPTRRENTLYQAVSNLSHRAGAHALRAGVDFLLNDDTITFLRTFRGSYTFSSMANFLTCNYNGYAQTFGDPVVNQKNPNVGFYAQDEWRASSRLTLNVGRSLRSAVPRDHQYRHQQRVAPCGVRVGADRVAGLPRSRRGGCLLRPGATARCGECALVSGQHDGRHATAPAASVGHSADAGRRSSLSQYPARPPAVHGPRVDHDDGQGSAECVLEAGEHRGRANARRQPHPQRRVSVFPR